MAFPDRQKTRLTYVDNARLTNGVNTFAVQSWNMNNVFDPDVTGAGHQPRFFDTYASIYARYIVTGVRVRVCVRQRAAHGLGVVFIPANGAPTLNPAAFPQEYRRASEVRITSSNQPPVQFDVHVDPAAVAGVHRTAYMADDRFQAGVASGPTEVIQGHFFVYNLDGATAVDAEYSCTLEYEVEFYDLAVPGPSLTEHINENRWTEVQPADARSAASSGHARELTTRIPGPTSLTPLQRFLSTRNSD